MNCKRKRRRHFIKIAFRGKSYGIKNHTGMLVFNFLLFNQVGRTNVQKSWLLNFYNKPNTLLNIPQPLSVYFVAL